MFRHLRKIGVISLTGWIMTALLGILPSSASAQTISGVIAGTVRDQQAKPLPGATITMTNPATGRSHQASSDESGYYRVPEIPPGEYQVTVEFGGLQTEKHVGVRVSVDQVTLENFTLKVPGQVSVVVVNSTAPVVDTTGATMRSSFAERQIRELPILTRDVNNLALLAPGVLSVRTFSFASTLVPFSVNGSRGRDNNFIIDSVDNNEPLFGGAATQFTNTDILAEYTILTHQLNAEFGRNSGATVNVITKSGSNSLHGSAFWFGQDNRFNALSKVEKTAFLNEPSKTYENIGGATLGGPLKKDRTFFLISYQWDRARDNLTNVFPVLGTLPTAKGLNTLKGLNQTPALKALLAVPSVAQVPVTPSSCFLAPAPKGFSTTNPCRTAPTTVTLPPPAPGVEFNVFRIPRANVFDVRDHQLSGRLDHKINNSNDIYGRYLFDDLRTPRFPLSTAGDTAFSDLGLLPEWRLTTLQRTQSFLLDHRYYRVKALNELRFSFSRIAQGIGAFDLPQAVREQQAAATVQDNFGGFGGSSGSFSDRFPAAGQLFTLGRDSRTSKTASSIFQIQENYSYIHGRHTFKFGADFVRTYANIRSIPSDLGQYVFGFHGTGGLSGFLTEPAVGPTNAVVAFQRLPDVLSNSAGTATGQGSDELPLRNLEQAYFFQDDIQVRPNFSLNFGLRYEYFGQPINRIHELNTQGPLVSDDRTNFGPRFGLAWAPWKRAVFRGGYGIMYNPVQLNIPLLIWQSGPISPFVVFSKGAIPSQAQASSVFPNRPFTFADLNKKVQSCSPVEAVQGTTLAGSVPLLNCSGQDTVDTNLRNPYVQNFSLGVQLEFAPSWLLDVGYVGSKGTKLFLRRDDNPFGGWDRNRELCTPFNNQNLACLRPRRLLTEQGKDRGAITTVTNAGASIYHALQVSVNKRLSRSRAGDFAFTAAYTWSHLIDNASEIFGPNVRFVPNDFNKAFEGQAQGLEAFEAITPFAQDRNNLRAERGHSSFDRRHRLALSFLWAPGPKRGILLGGWQLNGIVSIQSGQPFTPLNSAPFGACADAFGEGLLTNARPSIGNPRAPVNNVALVADPNCVSLAPTEQFPTGYKDAKGNSINPSTAHFVQVPLGLRPGQRFTVGSATFVAGSAGRNILVGPGIGSLDLALVKNFHWGESKTIQLRWEVYDVLNRANPGFAIGNVFATDAQPTPAFAFSPRRTAAGVTGVIPENAIDAQAFGSRFLSTQFMNTSSRRMQFVAKFIF